MSVLYSDKCSFLIDHSEYIAKIYKCVPIDDIRDKISYSISNKLFSIKSDKSKKTINKKRTRDSNAIIEEAAKIKQLFDDMVKMLPVEIISNIKNKYDLLETATVRDLSQKYFESNMFDLQGLNGGNNSDAPLRCKIKDEFFLIPPRSRFFCGSVKDECKKLSGKKFDIVVADPPWWNKYIRRLKAANDKLSYNMMYNEDIASIPVKELISDNCIIAVWCTNAPSNVSAVKDLIFPAWGVVYVTTWYWLKATIDLQPQCEFRTGRQKQPYERILLGKVGDCKIPHSMLVASVPSALHSHKPPLLDLLTPLINVEEPQTLELFARYLLPNTTSVGYEPLKWQHISLYEKNLTENCNKS